MKSGTKVSINSCLYCFISYNRSQKYVDFPRNGSHSMRKTPMTATVDVHCGQGLEGCGV